MERYANILRRDARAPLCLEPLPRWRCERAFRRTLEKFLSDDPELLDRGLDLVTSHHMGAQEVVIAVDDIIVSDSVTASQVAGALVKLLDAGRRFIALQGGEEMLEQLREALSERYATEKGILPEFRWEKEAAVLFSRKLEPLEERKEELEESALVHLNEVYDDCARTVQYGLWIIASSWNAAMVDSWLFESCYTFFHHIVPNHIAGDQGLVALLPGIISILRSGKRTRPQNPC